MKTSADRRLFALVVLSRCGDSIKSNPCGLARDPTSMPQPLPNETFVDVALEIGGPKLAFYGEREFTPAYYLFPFAFGGRHYLLVEGNRTDDLAHLVIELVPGTGVVTRCHF